MPSGAKVLIGVFLVLVGWYMLDSLLWGILLFIAALSVFAAVASWVDGQPKHKDRKTGTRVMVWFLNQPLLMEILAVTEGLFAGGTGTISGVKYAIMAGVVATAFRVLNNWWLEIKGMRLIDYTYSSSLPTEWKAGESLKSALGWAKKTNKQ